jgi:hypothetical protein
MTRRRPTFIAVLKKARAEMVAALEARGVLATRLTKTLDSPATRRPLYQLNSAARSRLQSVGAATPTECLHDAGLVTVSFQSGPRRDVPVAVLEESARRAVCPVVRHRFMSQGEHQ